MIAIPTLGQLYTGILTDLETQYGANISLIGKVFLRALAGVQSGKIYLLYLVIANTQKNIFVDTADSEKIGGTLERFGRVKLGRNPAPAVAAQYIIKVTGTVGATIKAQQTFKSDDTSLSPAMLYVLDNDYILVATTDYITVRALTAGVGAKLNLLDTLTATSPIAFVDSSVVVDSVAVDPLAAEDLEAYRTAIINSYRLETQGGSAADYRLWSQDAAGVRFVYPYARSGYSNEVNLFVEAVAVNSTDGKGTPSALMLLAVEDVVELDPNISLPILDRGRRPLTTVVNYLPVTPKDIDIEIVGAVGFTPAIKAALLIAITDAINLMRPFVSGADVLANKNDILDKNKLIGIIILSRPGAIFSDVTFTVDGVPLLTYIFEDGNIPYLNSVTYV